MCGILGLYSNNKIDKRIFHNALATIKYRGPDETKKFIMKTLVWALTVFL